MMTASRDGSSAQRAPAGPVSERSAAVTRVLVVVFALNLLVACAKLLYGAWTGTVSILSDGFHSLADTASNVFALVGVRLARKPADEGHPYGHRKFETLASAAIFVMLLLAVIQIARRAIERLHGGAPFDVAPAAFLLMLGTLAINLVVVRYEAAAGKRLNSEVLLADATHTRSDVLTSVAVIIALAGVKLGWPTLDPIAGLVVAGFIARAGFLIARDTSNILADRAVMDEDDIRRVVMDVPHVVGCHEIRTRGSADYVFVDLHLWFPADMALTEAHRLSHLAKDRLMARFPSVRDVIIHIEPPPDEN